MVQPGFIYFIKKFEYENGGVPTDKLLIPICVDVENCLLIRALTTSVQRISDAELIHGCRGNESYSIYIFKQYMPVGTKIEGSGSFSFHENTFVSVKDNLELMNLRSLDRYFEEQRITCLAKIDEDEYIRLIKCIKNSDHIKRGLKPILEKSYPDI